MKKNMVCLVLFVLFGIIFAENNGIAERANSLDFIGKWKTADSHETTILKQDDLLLEYNGFSDYPIGSGCHVGESKTFAQIILTSECGYALPSGNEYAQRSINEVESGDVLQRSGDDPHTMIVVNVDQDEITVVHSNWSLYHRVSKNTFTKQWLTENGFHAFRPGVDFVESNAQIQEQLIDAQVFGTYRAVVTGVTHYHPINQGTIVSHSGPGGKIIVSEDRTVGNTFSANVGVKAEIISASVGFSVTATFSRNLSYVRDVPPGKYGYVDLIYKYTVKNFDVYYKPFLGSESKVGSGKAYEFQAVQFNYRESNN